MNLSRFFCSLGVLILIVNFTSCKNAEFKPSHISLNISESKIRKVFLCEYKVNGSKINDTININYKEIWLEKKWSNYLNQENQEKFEVVDSTAQLIINFKNDHLFKKNIYWDMLIIEDGKGNVLGSDKGLLFLNADTLIYKPEILELFIVKVNHKYQPNYDTMRIGELLLKRQ